MEAIIALAGNPNSGKTTLFNELTGARQHVGNYPGVTVEKKQGIYSDNENKFYIVDLPGTYSLTAYSLEEVVTRDFLINEKPRMVVNIVDASNLERNLYLTLQFMEMGIPVCMALNMVDVAKARGIEIDIEKLSDVLGVPIIPTVARNGKGKKELMKMVARMVDHEQSVPLKLSYGNDIDTVLIDLEKRIGAEKFLTDTYPARWVALKYLEKDDHVIKQGRGASHVLSEKIEQIVKSVSDHLKESLDTYPEAMIADYRYGYINALLKKGIVKFHQDRNRFQTSDQIDQIVTNRFIGPVIMMAVLVGLYKFTFTYSEIPVFWLENFFGWLGGFVDQHLSDGLLKSLVVSGIIDGVGGVLGFTPLIMFMFFGIAILEDSGYLARVAYMLDRIFRMFGLHGSSVMAFIVSGGIAGGCAVPGVMAARTLKSPRERLATLLTVPFMNCGAKLPVFVLLVATFFPENETMLMMTITLISWLGALLAAKLLRLTIVKGESTPFVMELPPYRMPIIKGVLIHTWERTWQYLKKAGTVILGISILLWAMMTFPGLPKSASLEFEQKRHALISEVPDTVSEMLTHVPEDAEMSKAAQSLNAALMSIDAEEAEAGLRHSIAGRFGVTLERFTAWAGFDWRTNIALVGGFAAKEVIVSTLGTAYSLGDVDPEDVASLSETLRKDPSWRPLVALSLIIFTIFYAPCFVAVVCISRESGSWRWGAFSMVFNTILAFTLAVVVFQAGSFFGN
ncbi:MAG: ferrous iron transport protein B [Proteobacteria bacterium]|nr:ferrous iron transport protein B [Pseudomonadota bacterium]